MFTKKQNKTFIHRVFDAYRKNVSLKNPKKQGETVFDVYKQARRFHLREVWTVSYIFFFTHEADLKSVFDVYKKHPLRDPWKLSSLFTKIPSKGCLWYLLKARPQRFCRQADRCLRIKAEKTPPKHSSKDTHTHTQSVWACFVLVLRSFPPRQQQEKTQLSSFFFIPRPQSALSLPWPFSPSFSSCSSG